MMTAPAWWNREIIPVWALIVLVLLWVVWELTHPSKGD